MREKLTNRIRERGQVYLLALLFLFSFFGPSSVRAFVIISNAGKPAYWTNPNSIPYKFNAVPSEFQDAIHSGFQAWLDVPGVNLGFDYQGESSSVKARDGMNTITWVTEGWTSLSFHPPSRALAVTLSSFNSSNGTITDGDIYFNAQTFNWAVVDSSDKLAFIDVQNIATHEIGHVLGLDHSSESFGESNQELYEATMYYASGSGETSRRTPKSDDMNGILNLYPSSRPNAPVITSVSVVSSSSGSVTYEIHGENFSERTSFLLSSGDDSINDSVSRYRSMISSSMYEATFSLSGFPSGVATLVAFNDPSQIETYSLDVEGGDPYLAASSGGGGGCSMNAVSTSGNNFALALIFFVLMSLVIFQAQVAKRN